MIDNEEIALQLTLKAIENHLIEKDVYNGHSIDEKNANNIKAVNKFYNDVLANLYLEDSKSR